MPWNHGNALGVMPILKCAVDCRSWSHGIVVGRHGQWHAQDSERHIARGMPNTAVLGHGIGRGAHNVRTGIAVVQASVARTGVGWYGRVGGIQASRARIVNGQC